MEHRGLVGGESWRWNEGETGSYNAHLLYSPYPTLSFGLKGQSLSTTPWMEWGAGLRPLFFDNHWRSRFTLFYDGRINSSGRYENIAGGARIVPVDGIELFGHWDFRSENLKTGITLSLSHLLLGGGITAAGNDAGREGSVQAFLSMKPLKSMGFGHNVLMVYKLADTISDTPRIFTGSPGRSLYEFLQDMQDIARAPEIDAVLFDRQAFRTSFSNILEIEKALLELKEKGKKIYFYADSMGNTQYALAASVADEIFLSPQGNINLGGFSVTKLYLKSLLNRYGIKVYNFRSHNHKTAFDSLSESGMSHAQESSLELVYGALQDELDRMIIGGRKERITGDLAELYQTGFTMSAERAKSAGLVDKLMYSDQVDDWVESRRFRVSMFSTFRNQADIEWPKANRPNIALIYATGNVFMGEGIKGRSIGAESLAQAIRDARTNPLVKGIVLRIDSGGGSALASDLIARELALCGIGEKPKPVVVSMGALAASGAYMISAPAEHIFATPATITGSIGVITLIPELSGLLDKLEIGSDTVKTSESADFPNVFRPLSESEENEIRRSVMERYDSFVALVAKNRNQTTQEIDEVARGQIWTGSQAISRNLVDKQGGLNDAIAMVEDLIGTKDARIIEINPGTFRWNLPFVPDSLASVLDLKPKEPVELLPETLRDIIEFYKTMEEYESEESLYLMPYTAQELGLDSRD